MEQFTLILRNDFAKITIEVPADKEQQAREMLQEIKYRPNNIGIELPNFKSIKTGDLEEKDNALRATASSTQQQTAEQLEKFIDRFSLDKIIEEIAHICREKAGHIRENWQDEQTAKTWDKNALQLEKVKLY